VILVNCADDRGRDNCRKACPGMVVVCEKIGLWGESGTVKCETNEGIRFNSFNYNSGKTQ
jgi:hypothetical protein